MARKKKENVVEQSLKVKINRGEIRKITCPFCGERKEIKKLWKSNSTVYTNGYIPVCRDCINNLYEKYVQRFTRMLNEHDYEFEYEDSIVERLAVRRICQMFDIYYNDKALQIVINRNPDIPIIFDYVRIINLKQYYGKTYTNTIEEEIEV